MCQTSESTTRLDSLWKLGSPRLASHSINKSSLELTTVLPSYMSTFLSKLKEDKHTNLLSKLGIKPLLISHLIANSKGFCWRRHSLATGKQKPELIWLKSILNSDLTRLGSLGSKVKAWGLSWPRKKAKCTSLTISSSRIFYHPRKVIQGSFTIIHCILT